MNLREPIDAAFEQRKCDWFERPLLDRFEDVVARHGNKTAVVDEFVQLSYQELRRACFHLAQRVQAFVPSGKPVGLLLPNGALFPVAALACLAAGRPYVPIDPSYPAMRIEEIMRDAGVAALIIDQTAQTLEIGAASLPQIDIGSSLHVTDETRFSVVPADGPAAILYTSGSTGQPKGICYDQRAIMERVANATDAKQLISDDRVALFSSPTTIASLRVPFMALLNGATLHFADPRRLGINRVMQVLREAGVTVAFAVPILLRELLGFPGAKEAFRHARVIRTGGDVMLRRDLDLWRSVLPSSCRILITLTSTEMPAVFQWIVPREWKADSALLPVGYARPEVKFLLADNNGTPVTAGEVGELIVKSRYLALGRWQKGQLQPFPTDPGDPSVRILHTGDLVRLRGDGLAEMVGRKDRQIKIRGYRVNLGEVEAVLRDCPGVADAAVITRRRGEEVRTLVAYVVPSDRSNATIITELTKALAARLPWHMRPGRIQLLDAIPQLTSFKVDISALEKIDRNERMKPAAAEEAERKACAGQTESDNLDYPIPSNLALAAGRPSRVREAVEYAWTTMLNQRSFKADMPWGDAGGDSLDALRMWSLIEYTLNTKLSFDNLEQSMTPTALIIAIEKELVSSPSDPQKNLRPGVPLIFYIPPAIGDTFLQAQLRDGFGGKVRFEVIQYPSWAEMIDAGAGFDVLIDAAVEQILAATDEPCSVVGYSFGGAVAWAVACRLSELRRPAGFVGLIDARPYRDVSSQSILSGRIVHRILYEPKLASERARERLVQLLIRVSPLALLRQIIRSVRFLPAKTAFRFELYFTEELRSCAWLNWKPKPLDVPTFLFRSNEFRPSSPDFGWSTLCSKFETVQVDGGHYSMLYPLYRDVLCRRILETFLAVKNPPLSKTRMADEQAEIG